ncbi:MAG: LTA synthase family protein [Lachnospiraceae bacterium]|nr:LTA synthase family protein [Lachnospiraceae bacterium]
MLDRVRKLVTRHRDKPARELSPRMQKIVDFCNRFALLLQFAACFLLYFVIEWLHRKSFGLTVRFFDERTKVFLYNVILIYTTMLPAFLFRRRFFVRFVIGLCWLILGIANGITLAGRVTPLTGPDMSTVAEAMGVVTKYVDKTGMFFITAGLIVAGLVVVLVLLFGPVYRGKRNFLIIIPGILAGVLAFGGLTRLLLATRQLSSYFGNIAFAYQDYGFPYCLGVTLFATGIDEPDGYSEELINEILSEAGEPGKTDTENLPNIIVVQLESFFDNTDVRWLNFSEDPLPNWHELSKEYSSGFYQVPTVGAGTVNTEFETLTGMSLRYFGPGEYPYKGVLKKQACESAPFVLAGLGYSAHAVHNNYATFYSRKTVYANLGFNDFTSSEYMSEQGDVNEIGWMRDRTLIPHIGDALDATRNQDFVTVISVQGHGAYPTEDVIEEPAITVTGASDAEKNSQWEYYTNQIHEMDQFVRDLIDYVDERGEPSVILFYGDHLPTMGLSDDDLKKGTTYQTSYLMWDNIGLKRKKKDLCAYQVMAELFKKIGIHEGTIFNFHQTMQKNELYLYDLQTLQYDILYGERYVYGQSMPYSKRVMAMGVKPIVLDSIEEVNDHTYYIHGKNFTPSSRLTVNNEYYGTSFISEDTLLVTGVELKKGDWINVGQLSNSGSGKILGHTNTIVYGMGSLGELPGLGDAKDSSESKSLSS